MRSLIREVSSAQMSALEPFGGAGTVRNMSLWQRICSQQD